MSSVSSPGSWLPLPTPTSVINPYPHTHTTHTHGSGEDRDRTGTVTAQGQHHHTQHTQNTQQQHESMFASPMDDAVISAHTHTPHDTPHAVHTADHDFHNSHPPHTHLSGVNSHYTHTPATHQRYGLDNSRLESSSSATPLMPPYKTHTHSSHSSHSHSSGSGSGSGRKAKRPSPSKRSSYEDTDPILVGNQHWPGTGGYGSDVYCLC